MKDIKPSSPEARNRDKATAIDPWDTADPPPHRGESELTEHERALLDAWDRTTALSPADDAQFEARLLAALDELTCAPIALDARADDSAPARPIVLDLAGRRGRCRRPR